MVRRARDIAMVAATQAAERAFASASNSLVRHAGRGANLAMTYLTRRKPTSGRIAKRPRKAVRKQFTGRGRNRVTNSNPSSTSGARTARARGGALKKKVSFKAKPSKQLTKLVKQIVDPDVSVSTLTIRFPTKLNLDITMGVLANNQSVNSTFTDGAGVVPSGGVYSAFDTLRILDAASQMYNLKAYAFDFAIAAGSFNNENLKVHVRNASFSMDLRNNTQVAKEIILYVCKPKLYTSNTALADWVASLAADNSNIGGLTITEYGLTPANTKRFTKEWSYTTERVFLEPGCKGKLFVQGPQDKWYDYSKLQLNASLSTFVPGFGVSMFVVMRNTEVSGTTPGSAIAIYTQAGNGLNSTHGVSALLKWNYAIYAPELTEDAQRFPKYIQKFQANGIPTVNDNLMRIDPVEPATLENTLSGHGTGTGPIGT